MSPAISTKVIAFPTDRLGAEAAFLQGLRTEATRKVYRRALSAFREFLADKDLLVAHRRDVEAYRAALEQKGRAAASINQHLAALSAFFKFAQGDDLIAKDPTANARRPRVSDVSPRRPLEISEVKAMIAACAADGLVGLRDRTMIVTLAVQGLRLSELLHLKVEDLADEGAHRVATVNGKGGRVLRVPLAPAVWALIRKWCDAACVTTGPIFVGVGRAEVVQHGVALSPRGAFLRIRQIAKRAGLKRTVSPHILRHTAATEALQAGVPLHQVQSFLRHRDPSTTVRYDGHRLSLNNPAPHVLAGRLLDEPSA